MKRIINSVKGYVSFHILTEFGMLMK